MFQLRERIKWGPSGERDFTTSTAWPFFMKVKFNADRVKISGPRVDGSYTITFETGEYEYPSIKELPQMNDGMIIVEVISQEESQDRSLRE